ncbi:MAG TPA: GNAT family N-acetyltransferase [Anaerolineae bacterium]
MGWIRRGQSESKAARLAAPTDRPALADLLARAARQHGIHAIEEQVALLSSGVSAFTFAGPRASAFIGLRLRMPSDGERWAEIALLTAASGWDLENTLDTLLDASWSALRAQGVTGVVCLTNESWLHRGLVAAGFVEADKVITYLRNGHTAPPITATVTTLQPAGPGDAETILEINAAAFAPVWRYDDATTLSWLVTSEHCMIARRDAQPAGFALTAHAGPDGYAQLIRVAVAPEWQGQGIGRTLVTDSIRYGLQTNALGIALNTQASNGTSRHLYEALGFHAAGIPIDVMTLEVK